MKKSLLTILMIPSMMFIVPMVSSARTGAEEMIDLDVQEISLTYSGGVMHITGAHNQIVTIYNLAGVAVKSFRVEGQDKRFSLSLSDGVYIIKVGTSFTRKILVRR
ncbi:MAG: T9SS C-terminal target domain-containing protein [Prevotella sp.]|nr:T9SS C-terminal target domain-containing protein [Prevotella sp.]